VEAVDRDRGGGGRWRRRQGVSPEEGEQERATSRYLLHTILGGLYCSGNAQASAGDEEGSSVSEGWKPEFCKGSLARAAT
jgi:hypothetical protein